MLKSVLLDNNPVVPLFTSLLKKATILSDFA